MWIQKYLPAHPLGPFKMHLKPRTSNWSFSKYFFLAQMRSQGPPRRRMTRGIPFANVSYQTHNRLRVSRGRSGPNFKTYFSLHGRNFQSHARKICRVECPSSPCALNISTHPFPMLGPSQSDSSYRFGGDSDREGTVASSMIPSCWTCESAVATHVWSKVQVKTSIQICHNIMEWTYGVAIESVAALLCQKSRRRITGPVIF
jgi:hypothetical protein